MCPYHVSPWFVSDTQGYKILYCKTIPEPEQLLDYNYETERRYQLALCRKKFLEHQNIYGTEKPFQQLNWQVTITNDPLFNDEN